MSKKKEKKEKEKEEKKTISETLDISLGFVGAPKVFPEGRESELINLSMIQAEKKIREGTASSQLLVHFLKLGTLNNKLESRRIELELKLLEAKTESIKAELARQEHYDNVIGILKRYRGDPDEENEELPDNARNR